MGRLTRYRATVRVSKGEVEILTGHQELRCTRPEAAIDAEALAILYGQQDYSMKKTMIGGEWTGRSQDRKSTVEIGIEAVIT